MPYDTPHKTPAMLRENSYTRPCAHCGEILSANEGVAFLLWDDNRQRNAWQAAHGSPYDSASSAVAKGTCMGKLLSSDAPPPPPTGSIAAAQVQKAKTEEELLASLQTAPAFQMPDAEQLEPLMRQLAESMTTAIVQDVAAQFTETVPSMVADLLASARPVSIQVNERPPVTITLKHKALEDVLLMVLANTSPFLVGPAGSGKTTLAQQIAEVLARPFYMASRVTSEYKLTGFMSPRFDGPPVVVRTQFREAYEHGGVFLFDEVDASDADALTAFNAALAGNIADFPDGCVARHADFVAIAAGNTFGRGADRQYVGRNQLDAATLDRFQVYEVDYDEELELTLAGNDEWTRYCQSVRHAIEAEKVRHVVSPRASINGARLLAAGMARSKVEEACIWKGLDTTNRARVQARIRSL